MITWYHNAGSHKLHKPKTDWFRSGKAICGANISNPGYASDKYNPTQAYTTEISHYPKRFGMVNACKRCKDK